MRLTKLKLAGFKSFVDPTNVSLPGQLVGVVGPNGCGKSNIIDAVRWVLGESKASALRGESMQDVIFNGSTQRKPVSRASVELVFDNSLGRAAGQWSQYAELSIKRILTRNGESEYHINNLRVRRKDIQDVFMGTGLGARAYAIIEQGMISRIIEAKPDELRVFLEEAAGITKYKERRRETENRLADTRENLLRVDDIRAELGAQMGKLETQAEIAQKYHALHGDLTRKQQLLWLLRRNEAQAEEARVLREIENGQNAFEAQIAVLRETEAKLEAVRDGYHQANDTLHQAQTALFDARTTVTQLEAEIRHREESKKSLEKRLAQIALERAHWTEQREKAQGDAVRWQELLVAAETRVEQAEARHGAQAERLPLAEEQVGHSREAMMASRAGISGVEQKLGVQQTHRDHAMRALQMAGGKRDRLEQERRALTPPDEAEMARLQEAMELARAGEEDADQAMAGLQARIPDFVGRRRVHEEERRAAASAVADTQARIRALEALQQRVQGSGRLSEWLRQHSLVGATPLWRHLRVDSGWEEALEAVLRERLTAIAVGDADRVLEWAGEKSDAKLALILPDASAGGESTSGADALLGKVRCDDAAMLPVVREWLRGVRVADDLADALARRSSLAAGETLVVPAGHLVGRHSVQLFAADEAQHGLLERQREIESLQASLGDKQSALEAVDAALEAIDAERAGLDDQIAAQREAMEAARNRTHQIQVSLLRIEQIVERYRERHAQIENGLADVIAEEETAQAALSEAESAMAEARQEIESLQAGYAQAREAMEKAERQLRDEREALAAAEREWREAEFAVRECNGKIDEAEAVQQQATQQLTRIDGDEAGARVEIAHADEEDLEPKLQAALEQQVERERELAEKREQVADAENELRALDEHRLQVEQGLEPLREKVGDLRLKAQAATLNAAQYQEQLTGANADESALTPLLGGARPGSLQTAINGLQRDIEALGPVNLAALEELNTARERKGYLDEQANDLNEAVETLESAIRRIDRETRELLKVTFETVNGHFGELFPALFGGGRAELVMTGEEILDAGVQVVAQPPGKKNASIHLLSGGEKALTAIALVFGLFQLNPAPFCLLDEVDAPLDDTNTERFCKMVSQMSKQTQFLYISHNKITMEMAEQLVGVTMPESGVSRIVEVDIDEALRMRDQEAA
jgi:chromosome segregation protein